MLTTNRYQINLRCGLNINISKSRWHNRILRTLWASNYSMFLVYFRGLIIIIIKTKCLAKRLLRALVWQYCPRKIKHKYLLMQYVYKDTKSHRLNNLIQSHNLNKHCKPKTFSAHIIFRYPNKFSSFAFSTKNGG